MKKKFFINIIFIILFLCIIEIISFFLIFHFNEQKDITLSFLLRSGSYKKLYNPTPDILYKEIRPIEYRDKNKEPIVIFGCSFAYGYAIDYKDSVSVRLANLTNRTIYNRAKNAEGPNFMYYQLKNNVLKNIKNPKYIIYFFIPSHLWRNYQAKPHTYADYITIRYKITENEIKENPIMFPTLHSSFFVYLLDLIYLKYKSQDTKCLNKMFSKIIEESLKIIKINFPKTKFVIVYMPSWQYEEHNPNISNLIEGIDPDIKFIDIIKFLPDITTEDKYWVDNGGHPSSYAWEKIVPILTKELNL